MGSRGLCGPWPGLGSLQRWPQDPSLTLAAWPGLWAEQKEQVSWVREQALKPRRGWRAGRQRGPVCLLSGISWL